MDKIYEATSLCQALKPNRKGMQFAKRLADINLETNQLIKHSPSPDTEATSKLLEETDVIYLNDSVDNGKLMILKWTAKPNINGYGNPFTQYSIEQSISPIEIRSIPGAKTIDDVIKLVSDGMNFNDPISFSDCLLCFDDLSGSSKNARVDCILIKKDMYTENNGVIRLKEDIDFISHCLLNKDEIITLDNNRYFAKMTDIALCNAQFKKIQIKCMRDIVRSEIINCFPWSVGKQVCTNNKEWRSIRDFINQDDVSLIHKIAARCECTENDAKKHINKFLDSKEMQLLNNDFDMSACQIIYENNDLIKQKCIDLCYKSERDKIQSKLNDEFIEESKRLREVKDKIKAGENEIFKIRRDIDKIKKHLLNLQEIDSKIEKTITDKRRTEQELDVKLTNKIETIKQNSANFIADMAFISPLFSNQPKTELNIVETPSVNTDNRFTCFQGLHDHLADNLEAIGVHEDFASLLGLLLVASYRRMLPLLVAGPKSFEIANAFSESLFAQKAAVLDCSGEPCPEVIQKLNDCNSEVVIIRHAIQSRWTDYLPDMLSLRNKLVIVVHPFIEDLTIEPKSLFSYMMPVFTDCLLSGEQAGPIEPGVIGFDVHTPVSGSVDKVKDIKTKLYNGFMCKKMNDLFKDFCFVSKEADDYDETELRNAFILLVEFPYAYVTSQLQKLKQDVSDFNKKMLLPIAEYFDEIFE